MVFAKVKKNREKSYQKNKKRTPKWKCKYPVTTLLSILLNRKNHPELKKV